MLTRSQGNFIHGAGSFTLNHPYNIPLDRNFLLDGAGGGSISGLFLISPNTYVEGSNYNERDGFPISVKFIQPQGEISGGIRLYKDGRAAGNDEGTPEVGNFIIKCHETANSSIVYKIYIRSFYPEGSTTAEEYYSNNITINFVKGFWFGLVDSPDVMSQNLNLRYLQRNFTSQKLSTTNSITDISSNYQYLTFVYPKSYGTNLSITGWETDSSLRFDYTSAFYKIGEVDIKGSAYNVYIIDTGAQYEHYNFEVTIL